MPRHAISELRRCLKQSLQQPAGSDFSGEEGIFGSSSFGADSDLEAASGSCLALARVSGKAWRSEGSEGRGIRPLVSLDMQLCASRLLIRLHPWQLKVLTAWTASLGPSSIAGSQQISHCDIANSYPVSEEVEQPKASPSRIPRVRLAISLRALASLEASLEIRHDDSSTAGFSPASSSRRSLLQLQLPCLSATFKHLAKNSSRPRGEAALSLSRPHVVLSLPSAPSMNVVEWCEEKVAGGDDPRRRSAYWLVASARWRGDKPLALSFSSLPIGLCIALAPLLGFVSAFTTSIVEVCKDSPTASRNDIESKEPSQTGQSKTAKNPTAIETGAASAATSLGSRPKVQASLGAISLRLFAGSPCEPGAAHLVACLAEASGRCAPGFAMQARAVLSLSLFEQAHQEASRSEPGVQPSCLVDDLLAPCTLILHERLVTADAGRSPCGSVGLSLELDALHFDLGRRTHLCRLLRLCNDYMAALPAADAGKAGDGSSNDGSSSQPAALDHPDLVSVGSQHGQSAQEMDITIHSILVRLPGSSASDDGKGQASIFSASKLQCVMASSPRPRYSLQCEQICARLMDGRQDLEARKLSVAVSSAAGPHDPLDITVSVDGGVSVRLITGRFFQDLFSMLPSGEELQTQAGNSSSTTALEPASAPELERQGGPKAETQGDKTSGGGSVKFRLLVSALDLDLQPSAIVGPERGLKVQLLGASLFSWPPVCLEVPKGHLPAMLRQQTDISVEVISVNATCPGAACKNVPLLSPMSFDGSLILLSPELPATFPSRTELELCLSPILVAAGAWQLGLMIDVFSFHDPDSTTAAPEAHGQKACLVEGQQQAQQGQEVQLEQQTQHEVQVLMPAQVQPPMQVSSHQLEGQVQTSSSTAGPVPQSSFLSMPEPQDMASVLGAELSVQACAPNQERILLELRIDDEDISPFADLPQLSDADLSALPDFWLKKVGASDGYSSVLPVPMLRSVSLPELQQWQAVRLPDAAGGEAAVPCPRVGIRLGCSASITSVYALRFNPAASTHIAAKLQPSEDYEVDAWDDALGCFTAVSGSRAIGYEQGDAMLASMAQASRLLSVQLPALSMKKCGWLLVELEIQRDPSSSQLSIAISTPRLTWAVLNSGTQLVPTASTAVPKVEEPFGDFSFHGVRIGYWQDSGQGMAIGVTSKKFGAELYDMSTLSLVQLAAPEENHVEVAVRWAEPEWPSAVELRAAPERRGQPGAPAPAGRPLIDVSLGTWRLAMPAWAIARLVQMGTSLSYMGVAPDLEVESETAAQDAIRPPKLPCRLPVVLRNALPVAVVFGQANAPDEVLSLAAGEQRAYTWRHTSRCHRRLSFGLHPTAPRSAPLPLPGSRLSGEADSWWASMELLSSVSSKPDLSLCRICICVRRISCAQLEVELLPPFLLWSNLSYNLEFQFLDAGRMMGDVEATEQDTGTGLNCKASFGTNVILDQGSFLRDMPVGRRLVRRFPNHVQPDQGSGQVARAIKVDGWSRELAQSTLPALLSQTRLVGILPSGMGRIRFRRKRKNPEEIAPRGVLIWSPELPLCEGPSAQPFTTLLQLPSGGEGDLEQGTSGSVMCTCQDIWGVSRTDGDALMKPASDRPAPPTPLRSDELLLLPAEAANAPLPQVLWLRPLLRFVNRSAQPIALAAMPLGRVVAGPGESAAFEGLGDPRQLQSLELEIWEGSGGAGDERLSTGQVLLSGLTQFPFAESDELVSWRNSVRCAATGSAQGSGSASREAFLLLELRRCKLSGILREIVVEPMWACWNETGEEVLLATSEGLASPVLLHTAAAGESWTSSLGCLQFDPTFPLVAHFGVRRRVLTGQSEGQGDVILWAEFPRRCTMGQTTPVDIRDGNRCFRMLVTVASRKQCHLSSSGSGGGGVQIRFFAGAYVRSELSCPVSLQLTVDKDSALTPDVLRLPGMIDSSKATRATVSAFQPWPWLPLGAAAVLFHTPTQDPVDTTSAREIPTDNEETATEPSEDSISRPSPVISQGPSTLAIRLRAEGYPLKAFPAVLGAAVAPALDPASEPEPSCCGPWTKLIDLQLTGKASAAVTSGTVSEGSGTKSAGSAEAAKLPGAKDAGPAVSNLREILLADGANARLGFGQLRDVFLELPRGGPLSSTSALLNASYHVHSSGCLVLTLLPCEQPPLVCANFSSHTVWLSEAWTGKPSTSSTSAATALAADSRARAQRSWQRIVPSYSMELPCPMLQTLEVFPAGGARPLDTHSSLASAATPGTSVEAVLARLSLDPEAHDTGAFFSDAAVDGRWYLDVRLGASDDDLLWQPPVESSAPAPPALVVNVRCASGVCRVELRDALPLMQTGGLDARGATLKTSMTCFGTPLHAAKAWLLSAIVYGFGVPRR
ncbi:unnamed protein product [Polarella glacialis]|uniref:Uncharacterized protein n=1 Tax=Polarella glacialis TaxID=89957 RepID=A0A813FE78_POLGL|nr:unnamed protein product [Polarella glacialis]